MRARWVKLSTHFFGQYFGPHQLRAVQFPPNGHLAKVYDNENRFRVIRGSKRVARLLARLNRLAQEQELPTQAA